MAYYHNEKKKKAKNNGFITILIIGILFLMIEYIEIIQIAFIVLLVIGIIGTLIYFIFYKKDKKVNDYAEKKRKELQEAKIRLSKYFYEEDQSPTIKNCQEILDINENNQNIEKQFFNQYKKQTWTKQSYWDNKKKGDNYERQVGNYFENEGYCVEYRGLTYGKKDGGIDLIAKKEEELLLIQCKAWDSTIIKQKHVIKFLGDCSVYLQDYPQEAKTVLPIFVTTSEKSDYGLNQFLRYNPRKIKYIIMPSS